MLLARVAELRAGGFRAYDEDRLFSGAPDRHNWIIVGKKEIYIPYHNYRIDEPSVSADQILCCVASNPDRNRESCLFQLHS